MIEIDPEILIDELEHAALESQQMEENEIGFLCTSIVDGYEKFLDNPDGNSVQELLDTCILMIDAIAKWKAFDNHYNRIHSGDYELKNYRNEPH